MDTLVLGNSNGLPGATDNANAITLLLPSPSQAGEYFVFTQLEQSRLVDSQSLKQQTDQYRAGEPTANNTALIETATTVTGTHGTDNTMVKLAAQHLLVGERSVIIISNKMVLMSIVGRNKLIASGDIAVDPGNVGGFMT